MKYISSKEFTTTCDLIIHDTYTNTVIIPEKTPKRIFITGEREIFSQFIHILTNFKDKYELVYHGSDRSFGRFELESIKPYVSHIWAENCEITHPLVTRVPLGFRDDHIPKRIDCEKDILCYLNVGLVNDIEIKFKMCRSIRVDCLNHFKRHEWCTIEENVPFDIFTEKLNRSRFVICPMGFGVDTFRFYESAWLGCTPIIMSSGLDDLHRTFGALIVNSWDEVTEERLRSHTRTHIPDEVFDVDTYFNSSKVE